MRRRDLLTAAALAAVGGGALYERQQIAATAEFPGRDQGHWLRDTQAPPEPTETIETDVLIAGGGIAALTAAWQLAKRGVHDVLLVSGPEPHGNAAAGRDGGLVFPTGAHYLPLPSTESWHMREMLADFGVILGNPYGERPVFDERYVVHGPAERVLYRGAWQEGYLPSDDVGATERAEQAHFFALVDSYSVARGAAGGPAVAGPREL
jgi:glycine/D-amino acid oxidase-like deaminating enzyme